MLSNAYFLAKFRFDTAENEPAKNLQNFANFARFKRRQRAPVGLLAWPGRAYSFSAILAISCSLELVWNLRANSELPASKLLEFRLVWNSHVISEKVFLDDVEATLQGNGSPNSGPCGPGPRFASSTRTHVSYVDFSLAIL